MTDFDPATVPVKAAATVMLVRDGGEGPEVFMLRRIAMATFGAGMYVFPGGRVDDTDRAHVMEAWCAGLDDARASARLGIDHGGLAFWVAAVRECFEEAGVLLAVHADGSPYQPVEDDRRAVHAGELALENLCERDDIRLDVGRIEYIAHWITPIGEVRRFDTRFLVARAPEHQEPLHDDAETDASLWVRPADALASLAHGELLMMPPTIASLRFLAAGADCDAVMAAAAAIGDPPTIRPRLRIDGEGRVDVALPGDADYDSLPG